MKRALQIYVDHGPSEAERQTRIPKATIVANAKRNGLAPKQDKRTQAAIKSNSLKGEQRRTEVSKLAIAGSQKALKLIVHRLNTQGHDIPIRELGTIFGILTDKHIAISNANRGAETHSAVDAWLENMTGGKL